MNRARRFVTAAAAALLTACVTVAPRASGRPIDTEYVKSIVKGKTTMDEVRAKLGDPASVTDTGDSQQWTYRHWEGKPAMFGSGYEKSKTTVLIVRFKSGKVADYSITTSGQ